MNVNRINFSLIIVALTLVSSPIQAQELASLDVYPEDVNLLTLRGKQKIVVQATYDDGITRDVTNSAKISLVNPKLAKIENNQLFALSDGETYLQVEFGGKSKSVPVKVKDANVDRPISFKLDIMPIFMRADCNSGGCHGAARGKDGFRLSLFGFDPDGDHFRLTREQPGRRINLAIPNESLLIEKALGKVPHTGGQRIKEGDQYYNDLIRWMEAKAPNDPKEIPTPISLEMHPKLAVLDGTGENQQMIVRAKYSDGSDRDVTSLALFMSNNENSAKINEEGLVTANQRGETFVMARFATFTVGAQVIVLPKGLKFTWPNVEERNYVDTLVHNKLRKLRITPSEVCDDETFLRRVSLDIVGLLPTPEEYHKFKSNNDPKKREQLIDELLERKEFAELWVLKWAELLQIRSSQQVSYKAMLLYYEWLQQRVAKNVPVNEWVQELIGASGGTFKNPATNFYQNETDILKVAENVAQVFMGMRIQCAQCHNHPFDRWTMDDYFGFTAFFSQIGRKAADDPREVIVFNSGGGEVTHPVLGRVMKPRFLGGGEPELKGEDRRVALGKWLASPENPYFATGLANRVWQHFFGIGIIDEVDDVRISNPASNPELLAELGKRFTSYNYDFKKLIRDICNSRTYQLSTIANDGNAGDTRNFARSYLRRIKAESFLDCISQVTETRNKFPGLPNGARAVQIADGSISTYFLTTFGRPQRETVCSCEVRLEPTLSQSLHLLNGDATTSRIASGNLIGRRLDEKKAIDEIIEELYVRCFSRKPTDVELLKLKDTVEAESDKKTALEDVFWSLLNSREFMFNH